MRNLGTEDHGTTSILSAQQSSPSLQRNLWVIDANSHGEEVKALDDAPTLLPVYPTWFIERLVDAGLQKALCAGTQDNLALG